MRNQYEGLQDIIRQQKYKYRPQLRIRLGVKIADRAICVLHLNCSRSSSAGDQRQPKESGHHFLGASTKMCASRGEKRASLLWQDCFVNAVWDDELNASHQSAE